MSKLKTKKKIGKKDTKKIYHSLEEFERDFFPNSYKKGIIKKHRENPSIFGSELAAEILKNMAQGLRE